MKYSFVTFSCPEASLGEVIQYAKQFGYDGVEIRSGKAHQHGIELQRTESERQFIRDEFEKSGIEPCCLSVSCHYSNPDDADNQVSETEAYLRLAADIGIPLLRVFCGVIPVGVTREASFQSVVNSLKKVATVAERYGITIVVETHDDWSNPSIMAEVLRTVDHPSVAVVWDIIHTFRTGKASFEEAYQQLSPWVQHVHIHDGSLRTDKLEYKPIGEGDYCHRTVLRILQEAGYKRYLSGEWLRWEAPAIHLPREIKTMKDYEKELFGEL